MSIIIQHHQVSIYSVAIVAKLVVSLHWVLGLDTVKSPMKVGLGARNMK